MGGSGRSSHGFFRQRAVEHLETDEQGGVIRISPPWTWMLLAIVGLGLAALVLLSTLGHIEMTTRASGVVERPGGVGVVSFLPEQERASVNRGDRVEVQLGPDERPGRIVAIADDVARRDEIRRTLGAAGPACAYRVEIALDAGAVEWPVGSRVSVRYVTRRERPIALFLDPLRRRIAR